MFPSGPAVIQNGAEPAFGSGYSLNEPFESSPIAFALRSVNQIEQREQADDGGSGTSVRQGHAGGIGIPAAVRTSSESPVPSRRSPR
jgi:hypothetical protein